MPVNLRAPSALPPVAGVRIGSTRAIKSKHRDDLTVMHLAAGSNVAGVFTQNRYPAPPVSVCRAHLARNGGAGGSGIRALAINAGIANAGTLGQGLRDARESCRLLGGLLGCAATRVLPFSTGVIMEHLPMQNYARGLVRCVDALSEDHWLQAARAIMTTDTLPKGASAQCGAARITGIAKGSGMIHPNMATMLAFVATDAHIPLPQLQQWQRQVAAETFNTISVDGDTSTNDSFILIATGKAGAPRGRAEARALRDALLNVSAELAQAIVRDGEGAQKFVVVRVHGGSGRAVCRRVADAIARSPLVKTALAAGDANMGRLLMAIGNAGAGFAPEAVSLSINGVPVLKGGGIHPHYSEKQASKELQKAEVEVQVRIGNGSGQAVVHTCDLTKKYIEINADYRS